MLMVPSQSGFQLIGRAGLIDLIGFEGLESRLEKHSVNEPTPPQGAGLVHFI
jgi:hypothetical protein